jgi:pimeloyl-ACP methyl ester carboxylesterase
LHYVEEGEGPARRPAPRLPRGRGSAGASRSPRCAQAGFRVVAPDLRGFNLSSKPKGVSAYELQHVAFDIKELIESLGERAARVAGHDWGGATAWELAMRHPEVVDRLAILNSPHPLRFRSALRNPRQLKKSWYFGFFQLPRVPEMLLPRDNWAGLKQGFAKDARPGTFTPEDAARYVEAWEQPGAASASVNYYRAAVRRRGAHFVPIAAPTLVLWGDRDRYLAPSSPSRPPKSPELRDRALRRLALAAPRRVRRRSTAGSRLLRAGERQRRQVRGAGSGARAVA